MFKYKVYEEFIPEDYQKKIESFLITKMMWKYVANVSGRDPSGARIPVPVAKDQGGFTGYIFSHDLAWPANYELIELLEPMIDEIRNIFPFDIKITRIRAGLFPRSTESAIHVPHVDFHYPHYTFLYYANDSDGDTVLFNERAEPTTGIPEYPKEFSVMNTVSPKRGRAVLFNGLNYHSSSTTADHSLRLAINVNFIPADAEGKND